ncbi:MAG TPA: DNA polymerase domain-containing protein [Thermomicrobiales bacterium]|nr:DNA polymerase domain-containing protein [Thermomicrobiales bacterium]
MSSRTVAFEPWLVTTAPPERAMSSVVAAEAILSGSEPFGHRVSFDGWSHYQRGLSMLRDAGARVVGPMSIAEQYLISSGESLFTGMTFDEVVRAQIDIETLGLDAQATDAQVVIITACVNGAHPLVLRADELSEAEMIHEFTSWIHDHDPDLIEGHNVFNFDLPYLAERARVLRVPLSWGRDGSELRLAGEQRFKAGARTIPYQGAYVYGRHVVDTYQQVQRYDVGGLLDSYALKPAIQALGLERSGRTHVDRRDIAGAWHEDRETLARYAIDDVLDVNVLSALTLPTEFYQCSIVPRTLQSVATGGPGEKINDILVRAYVSAGWSIPLPEAPRGYPGGYAELRKVGVFSPVVKCDVESLYPSIMLADAIAPARDRLNVFLPTLATLTEKRLSAKRSLESAHSQERALWQGIQSSLKVLINSFYGYLGYSRGYFNDFAAAERVTLRGQEIIQRIVAGLEQSGCAVIEIDTDGVLLEPPTSVQSEEAEQELVEHTGSTLGDGIRLAHDGRYRGMLSLRLKNYALLTYEGRVILKGSSLRSRREEPFLRVFLADAVARILEPDRFGDMRSYYLDIAERIRSGLLEPSEIARTETVTENTFRGDTSRRLAAAVAGERIGERVQVYQRADGSLARIEEFDDDPDHGYLLRRLRDTAMRFRPIFDSDEAFDYTFPLVTLETDLTALRSTPRSTQLTLFET